jgi:CRP-like cAMP-binding protein
MANSTLIAPKINSQTIRALKRREHLPLRKNSLWKIEAGAVRTYTLTEDGTLIVLGLWSVGDTVGQPLACIQPYEIECLEDVKVRELQLSECWELNQMLLYHLQQTQVLLRLRSGRICQRLPQLLKWLADKFGQESEQGQRIQLRLTHQDIADTLGTTRVTVTRLLRQLEEEGNIDWVEHHLLLPSKS